MKGNEIRRQFLKFFEDRGHEIVRSSSLIPSNDPTLLFANAGMNQFKDTFLGRESRNYVRAVSSQKCVRAGGKHNDLDVVGHTRRHHTFFEMLGNFSFGDYFKLEAIEYAWTLLTREFGIPADRLWITVFRDDDDAAAIWEKHIGVGRDRIVRMDEKDNFWQMGDTGPCGPCSEIHYDLGSAASESGDPDETFPSESGRYVEIWNLVFMQFNRDAAGVLTPLPKPSIDTGMGLERIASVLQGKISNFDTDLIRPLIERGAEILGAAYGQSPEKDACLRIVADHVRATTFLISDGVVPANEGRGYVLRKIMRRGIRQGTLLGHQGPFMYQLCDQVADLMKDAYPELLQTREYVARLVKTEEERFIAAVALGLSRLEEALQGLRKKGAATLPGSEIFKLYDTFGFPLDFTKEIADEKGVLLDLDGFEAELAKQRERARQSWKGDDKLVSPVYAELATRAPGKFLGYADLQCDGRVVAIIRDGQQVQTAQAGEVVEVVLDQTPFYAESGGQVGDVGAMIGPQKLLRVADTVSPVPGLIVHKVHVEHGAVHAGDVVRAEVDADKRSRTAANHTGTHLLHAALRDVLGTHVKQAGSLVSPDRLRFDFTHFGSLSLSEIHQIEERVNRAVLANIGLEVNEMDLDEAIQNGALAFFGEKYQQKVRVVGVPGVSKELCGGTHVQRTGAIGLFKIVSETSVASGVRRLEAVTGQNTLGRLDEDESLLRDISQVVKAPRTEVVRAVQRMAEHQRLLEREIEGLKRKSAGTQTDSVGLEPRDVKGVKVVAQLVVGVEPAMLREVAERANAKLGSGVVVLGVASDGKAAFVAVVSKDLQKRIHAGQIAKRVAAVVGGNGGGRPDFAQAGGKDVEKLELAVGDVYNIVADLLE